MDVNHRSRAGGLKRPPNPFTAGPNGANGLTGYGPMDANLMGYPRPQAVARRPQGSPPPQRPRSVDAWYTWRFDQRGSPFRSASG